MVTSVSIKERFQMTFGWTTPLRHVVPGTQNLIARVLTCASAAKKACRVAKRLKIHMSVKLRMKNQDNVVTNKLSRPTNVLLSSVNSIRKLRVNSLMQIVMS